MAEPVGAFEAVVSAFSQQVAELREATLLRVDGEPPPILGVGAPAAATWHPCSTITLCCRPTCLVQTAHGRCIPRTWKPSRRRCMLWSTSFGTFVPMLAAKPPPFLRWKPSRRPASCSASICSTSRAICPPSCPHCAPQRQRQRHRSQRRTSAQQPTRRQLAAQRHRVAAARSARLRHAGADAAAEAGCCVTGTSRMGYPLECTNLHATCPVPAPAERGPASALHEHLLGLLLVPPPSPGTSLPMSWQASHPTCGAG